LVIRVFFNVFVLALLERPLCPIDGGIQFWISPYNLARRGHCKGNPDFGLPLPLGMLEGHPKMDALKYGWGGFVF